MNIAPRSRLHSVCASAGVLILTLTAPLAAADAREPDKEVVARLQKIVALRQTMAEHQRQLVAASRAPDDGAAELALAQARLELARELAQEEQILAELQKIVALYRRRLEVARSMADQAVKGTTRLSLAEAEIQLLQAQIAVDRELARRR